MRERSSPGRPREFEPDEIMDKIMGVFWKKGYEGTSLNDLMDATDLKKGSLYAAFGDKRAMYLKSLAAYETSAVQGAVTMLTGTGTPRERIARFLNAPIEAAWDHGDFRGCFLCNASTDRASLDAEVAKAVRTGFERMAHALEAALTDANSEKPTEGRALVLLSVYSGLRGMVRAGLPRDMLEVARDEAIAGSMDR
jgi:AcrR family transcriptional regulator